jgi:hypothetical protein
MFIKRPRSLFVRIESASACTKEQEEAQAAGQKAVDSKALFNLR